jgi:hypothetical protein
VKRRPAPPAVDLAAWKNLPSHGKTLRVLEWLSDDAARAELYRRIQDERGGHLWVPSAARHDRDSPQAPAGAERSPHRVLLLVDRDAVRRALTDGERFSNAPYRRLGSGDFLLGLDPQQGDADAHAAQSAALVAAFAAIGGPQTLQLAAWSARAATIALAGAEQLDLAAYAEHAALRFVQVAFGYAGSDLPLLEGALRKAYRAMTVQMLGRHFVVEPAAVPAGRQGLAELARRTADLLRDHALGDDAWPEGLERAGGGVPELSPVLRTMARRNGPVGPALAPHDAHLDVAGLSVAVAGALAGTVGNVQAAACIAIQALMAGPHPQLQSAIEAAHVLGPEDDRHAWAAFWSSFVAPALRADPPAPFLPRRLRVPVEAWGAEEGDDVVLCVGGGTSGSDANMSDAVVFGLDPASGSAPAPGLHLCTGARMAQAMVSAVVAEVLRLPGLAEQLDGLDGRPVGLTKRWGFACESYPLRHRRDLRIVQQPLNVYMRVRQPAEKHGAALRALLRHGAARIERLLRESRHVHFAWFEFLEDGHVLALHTVFDGDFEAYLQHFAFEADTLFDELFKHLEPGLQRPVAEAPEDFVRTVLAHHRPAAGHFFFSAYPDDGAARVQAALARSTPCPPTTR